MSHLRRILVVDDDPEMTLLLRAFLKNQGYSVATSSSVEGALNWIASQLHPPDLIVSDVKMGTTSGIEFTKRLSYERPNLPVVLFSVLGDFEKEAIEAGAVRFLTKPFSLVQLASILDLQLKGKSEAN